MAASISWAKYSRYPFFILIMVPAAVKAKMILNSGLVGRERAAIAQANTDPITDKLVKYRLKREIEIEGNETGYSDFALHGKSDPTYLYPALWK